MELTITVVTSFWEQKEDDKTIDKFYGNIRKVIDKIQSLNSKTKIVFIALKRGRFGNEPVYPASMKLGIN